MEVDPSAAAASKRLRTDDSSVEASGFLSDDVLVCSFCTFTTESQADFDFHNHVHHQHVCSQCQHVFPSYFLLELHVDEVHNTYSASQSYRCLIETCPKVFPNLDQRSQHISAEHHTKNRSLTDMFALFSSQPVIAAKNKGDNKFGCDSQKTFIRNPRLKPREYPSIHWDGDDD